MLDQETIPNSCGPTLAVITVTYHPDLETLRRQAMSFPKGSLAIYVDNASPESMRDVLSHGADRIRTNLLQNERNLGLAAALNQGIERARMLGCSHVLLLDQDTEPHPGAIDHLFSAATRLRAEHGQEICVGPSLRDSETGLFHGFHVARQGIWRRKFPDQGRQTLLSCSALNGSGTLVSVALFERTGGLDESLFIDHVDSEWSFRAAAAGCKLFGVADAVFDHRMGRSSRRYWMFGWRVYPYRSPQRHYFLFRNTIALLRRNYVPLTWKIWAPVKLGLTLALHLIFDPERWQQLTEMLRGLRAGLRMPNLTPKALTVDGRRSPDT